MPVLVLAALFSTALAAQPLTQGERDRVMSDLHATRKQLLDAVGPLSARQLAFKPAPDRWSVAEVAEHIIVAEGGLLGGLQAALAKAPEAAPPPAATDDGIRKALSDRSKKVDAPEPFRPTGRWKTRDELISALKQRRDETIAWIRTTDAQLRRARMPGTPFGTIDGYQWMLLTAGHSGRHFAQIQEVMAAPGFPKK